MAILRRKKPWETEMESVLKKESELRRKKERERKPLLDKILRDRIPSGLSEKLDEAFCGAFSLLFAKGTGAIEKTYPKSNIQYCYQVQSRAAELKENRKNLRAFTKKAGKSGTFSRTLAGVEGIGLGLLGIGLPDIPLFTAVMLRSLYELGDCYGFGHEREEELYWILLLIQGGLSDGAEFLRLEEEAEAFIETGKLPDGYKREKMEKETAKMLSKELLYMKFLQGIPVAGAVGGACDAACLNRIQAYAQLKYRKRFLLTWKREQWKKEQQKK